MTHLPSNLQSARLVNLQMWHLLSLPIGHLRCSLLRSHAITLAHKEVFLLKPISKVRDFRTRKRPDDCTFLRYVCREKIRTNNSLFTSCVGQSALTVTISNSNYKLKKMLYRSPPSRIMSG